MTFTSYFLCLAASSISMYAQGEWQKATLKGVEGVAVVVTLHEFEFKETGLTLEVLKADTELRLRQSRIKVQDNVENLPGRPELLIALHFLKASDGVDGYAVSFDVSLRQDVLLHRNKELATGRTWAASTVALSNSRVMKSQVRETLAELVDRFLNDFLAANPK